MEDIGNYGYTLFRIIPVGIFRSLVFDKNASSEFSEALFLLKMARRNSPQPCFCLKWLVGILRSPVFA